MISQRGFFSAGKILLAATVVATVFFAAAARAQGGANANPSVTVDLSVIEQQGSGATRRSLGIRRGLRMPTPGVFPQSQLYEPGPSTLPYATLTPPRQRAVNLRPPGSRRATPRVRALELTKLTPSPRPQGTSTSIGQEPRAVTAPSRTRAVVGPTPSLPQTLGPDDTVPARLEPRPPHDVAAAASTVASTEPAPASVVSTPPPPPLPPANERASTPPKPERAGSPETTAAIEPPSTPKAEQAGTTPIPEAEEKTVALQPASRGEQAPLPPSEGPLTTGELLQVEFQASETNLTNSSRAELKGLADRLRSQQNLRLQLLAYAEGEGVSPSKARRMSLSRALSVRSYLIENGIKTSRIDVRALGNKAASAPLDRVDVKVVQR